MTTERATHWDNAYANGDTTRSWYQPSPTTSLRLLEEAAVSPAVGLIDVGGGASTLVDALLVRGHIDLTVLDVSARGLDLARDRLRSRADSVTWIVTDLLNWVPPRRYAVWHDRAVFHFLTDPVETERYRSVLSEALEPGGLAMVGAFATDGPTHCSGLEVARYDGPTLAEQAAPGCDVVTELREEHHTPSGGVQPFTWVVLRRPVGHAE